MQLHKQWLAGLGRAREVLERRPVSCSMAGVVLRASHREPLRSSTTGGGHRKAGQPVAEARPSRQRHAAAAGRRTSGAALLAPVSPFEHGRLGRHRRQHLRAQAQSPRRAQGPGT
jgi:hypothetical protein